MTKLKPITFMIDEETEKSLVNVAKSLRTAKSEIIRIGLEKILKKFESDFRNVDEKLMKETWEELTK